MSERTYTLGEAATELKTPFTTLRDRVTACTVPHHRRSRVKGVYFTVSDLDAIRAAEAVPLGSALGRVRDSLAGPRADAAEPDLAAFASLKSLRAT